MADALCGSAGRHTLWFFFLIETFATHPVGATFERQDAIVHIRLKFGKNRGVILGQVELGVALRRPEDFVRMRNRDRQLGHGHLVQQTGIYPAALRFARFADVRAFFAATVFFAATAFFGLGPGSPVAAFSTSPSPSRAMSARSLLLTIERGFSRVTSLVEVYWSRCLMSSHDFPELLPQPCVRTSTHDPFNFLP